MTRLIVSHTAVAVVAALLGAAGAVASGYVWLGRKLPFG